MIPAAHSPTPAEIIALRASCGLTQANIAQLLHANDRTWRQWESGDRRMHPAFWELLKLKLARKNILKPAKKPLTEFTTCSMALGHTDELHPIRPGSGKGVTK